MKKMLLINNIPTPYREFMFRKMYEIGLEYDIEMTIAFQARKEKRRDWDPAQFSFPYKHFFSQKLSGRLHQYFSYKIINRDIILAICSKQYDAVIYAPFMSLSGWLIALTAPRHITKILWSESNLLSASRAGVISRLIKRSLLSRFDKMALPGERAKEYVESIRPRLSDIPILHLPNLVDHSLFVQGVSRLRGRRDQLRNELGIPEGMVVFLCVGQLIEKKGYHLLLESIKRVQGPYQVIILGNGPLDAQWKARTQSLGIDEHVVWGGFQSEQEMLRYYAASDFFLHTAIYDPSPLVTIEAISAGLPVLVSRQTGNAPETVRHGVNGYTFDIYNPDEVASSIQQAIGLSVREREAMGVSSRKIAKDNFDPDTVIRQFFDML